LGTHNLTDVPSSMCTFILSQFVICSFSFCFHQCLAGIGLQLDSGCVERLLSSPSANSLLYLCLECRVIEEAKESFKKLKAMVEENKRKYRERYGREQTKVLCDCFEF